MSKNLVSMNNLQSILEPIGKNIVNKINDKDISQEQKEKLNKVDIINTNINSSSFLSDKGKYDNININNLNENIDKTNNVYDIFKIKDSKDYTWTVGTPMPTSKRDFSSCIYNDKIYCIGGRTISAMNTIEIYDIENNTWSVGNCPTARYGLTSCIHDDKIYCIGGTRAGVYNIVEIYDIKNNIWSTGTPMPTSRSSLTSCIYDDKIYCIGGGSCNKVEIYDIKNNIWSTGTPMPTIITGLSSCIYNDKIYCIGNIVEIYDIKNNIWSTGTTPNIAIGVSCIYNDKIYCIGNNVEIYDIKNNIWSTGTSAPRSGYISEIYNGKIYCIGNNVDILSLPYTSYDITLPLSIQNKLDCISNLGAGTKILSDKGEYIDIPKGYRFMESNEVTDFINEIKVFLSS